MPKVITRFAPSPTGYLHVGSLRTALYNFLFAKHNKGEFVLRIEDTDQKRFVADAEKKLIAVLQKIGLNPDNKIIIRQSERLKIYQELAEKLVAEHQAYYCNCSQERLEKLRAEQTVQKQVPKYDGHCRSLGLQKSKDSVIRFKIPASTTIEVEDTLHGKITVKSSDLDDFVLMKSDGYPTYHLANVIDDHEMKITHVIRADEWLPSLPKHKLLYQAFGYDLPIFVHLPLLLNPDKSKLSKRQGDVAVEDYLNKGYLPEAILNYIALLGWNPKTDREVFSLDELISEFSLENLNKAGAIFDIQKLNWFNAEYIRQMQSKDPQKLAVLTKPFLTGHENKVEGVLKLFGSRLNYLAELTDLSAFLWHLPDYSSDMLIFKKSDKIKTKKGLTLALLKLSSLQNWKLDHINSALEQVVTENNLTNGDVFWPIRVSLSGLEKSPSPGEILEFLGQTESLERIKRGVEKI